MRADRARGGSGAALVAGLTVNDIAAKLKRSKQTISTQKASAMRKLGAERDADLLLLFQS